MFDLFAFFETHACGVDVVLDAGAALAVRRAGGASLLIRARVVRAVLLADAMPHGALQRPSVLLLLQERVTDRVAAWLRLSAPCVRLVAARFDLLVSAVSSLSPLSLLAVPGGCVPVARAVSGWLWSLSSATDLHALAASVAVELAAAARQLECFGVGRAGKIAASYCARLHVRLRGSSSAPPPPSPLPAAALVFVARDLDLVPACGGAIDSLFDAAFLHGVASLHRVPLVDEADEADGALADDVLCSASAPFRAALTLGTQQAAFECVQRALLDVLPPDDMASFTGALTLAKAKKAEQLLAGSPHHTLRLELALLQLALAPTSKRIARRRESALRVALALARTDNFGAGVSHLEAQAAEGAEWSRPELLALVRAFVSALGQAPARDAVERMFGAGDEARELHAELERIAGARSSELRRLAGALVNERGEYAPFLRTLARQLFVERDVDAEKDCVHVQADDEVLGADYAALAWPSGERAPTGGKAAAFGLLSGAQKKRVSDFSTVYIVVCGGVANATEVRLVREQVQASSLASALNVHVISAVPE